MNTKRLEEIKRTVEKLEQRYGARVSMIDLHGDNVEAQFSLGSIRIEVVRELLDEIDELERMR